MTVRFQKPVHLQAEQFTGAKFPDILTGCDEAGFGFHHDPETDRVDPHITIDTDDGELRAYIGDWIGKRDDGTFVVFQMDVPDNI